MAATRRLAAILDLITRTFPRVAQRRRRLHEQHEYGNPPLRSSRLGASRELPHCAGPVLYMISSLYLAGLDGVNVDRHDLEVFPRSGNSEESS